MESVLALEVGAAARRIFSKAICRGGQAWRDASRKGHYFLLLHLLKLDNFKPTLQGFTSPSSTHCDGLTMPRLNLSFYTLARQAKCGEHGRSGLVLT